MTHWLTFVHARPSRIDGEHSTTDTRTDNNACSSSSSSSSSAMHAAILLVALVVVTAGPRAVRGGLVGIVQNNVLGSPEFHRQQPWPFDPHAGSRRAAEFVALHGDKSERLIERIGLGLDGRQNERREQQTIRDYRYGRQNDGVLTIS